METIRARASSLLSLTQFKAANPNLDLSEKYSPARNVTDPGPASPSEKTQLEGLPQRDGVVASTSEGPATAQAVVKQSTPRQAEKPLRVVPSKSCPHHITKVS